MESQMNKVAAMISVPDGYEKWVPILVKWWVVLYFIS